VRTGALSAEALCAERLEAAGTLGRRLGAINHLPADAALAAARAVDAAVRRGEDPGPLAGIPVALKDNLCTVDSPTTCSSKILGGYQPPYDATAIARLRAAGAVILAKTNMDEFAMGSSTENSAFEPCRNPWDPERVPGGSSGGSAALVASGIVPAALGSDTGGSVRQPASLCGIVGLLPTWGRVSRSGLVAFASSLDQIGTLTASTEDAALLLGVIAGADPLDDTSAPEPVPDYVSACGEPLSGLTFGVPEEYFGPGADGDVRAQVERAIEAVRAGGGRVVPVSLPHTEWAIATYYIVATAEASSNLARFDGVRYGPRAAGARDLESLYADTRGAGFGNEVRRRIMLGTYVLSAGYYDAFYLKAQRVRESLRADFLEAFRKVDLLLTPTAPTPAFRIGEKSADPLAMYLSDIFTATSNLANVPALSLPCGLSGTGLPIGLQVIGPPFGERRIFRAASAIESAVGFCAQPALRFESRLAAAAVS